MIILPSFIVYQYGIFTMEWSKIVYTLATVTLISACNDGSNNTNAVTLNESVRTLVAAENIEAIQKPAGIPSADSAIVQLGKKLFFTKSLAGDMDTACASCHHPNLGGGDDLPLSIGVAALEPDLLGPGRLHLANGEHHDGGPTVPRNAPTTMNFVFYDKSIFHDGRIQNNNVQPNVGGTGDSIRTPEVMLNETDPNAGSNLAAAQARFPVTSAEEMRGFTFEAGNTNNDVRIHLENRLQGKNDELARNDWLVEFQKGFADENGTAEELVTFDNIAFALGEYERSQVLINSPWNAYLTGDENAMTESAKRGALLFYQTPENDGFNCVSCHSGSFFTDEKFHVVAIPQIGRGKGNGETEDDDFGRFRESAIENDKYAFRTPHLLNVTETGPYGHSGAYQTLTEIIEHHLNAAGAIENYEPSGIQEGIQINNWRMNTQAALTQLTVLRDKKSAQLIDQAFTSEQVADVVSFLEALTDPCTETPSCMNQWVPSADEVDPDGLRLISIDNEGNLL
jgi:cytochrome c peroxidase